MARFASRRAPPCSAFKSDVAERLARWPLIPARARSDRPANKTASRGIAAPLPPVCHRHRSTRRTSVLSPPSRRRSFASKASYKAGQCPSDASESSPATFPATRTRPEAEPSLRLTPGTCTTSPQDQARVLIVCPPCRAVSGSCPSSGSRRMESHGRPSPSGASSPLAVCSSGSY